jgi:UDP-N-acetylglucosamine acyltransferase
MNDQNYQAHPTAIIHNQAIIGEGTTIGPYSIIGPLVRLGKNNKISPHVVLDGLTEIGDNNIIYQFASIGSAPQDQKWQGEPTRLIIGSGNQIREYVTIQPSNSLDGTTIVGDNNLFMACSHIAHDAIVGNDCWFANSACVAGHAIIGDRVIMGGLSGVHQYAKIGDLAFIAAGSIVTQDIPPFCTAQGDRARLVYINKVGLQRAGYSEGDIRKIHVIFRTLFYENGIMSQKIHRLQESYSSCQIAKKIINFIGSSQRGIAAMSREKSPQRV